MQGICISAMLQSQQCWLPVLREPTPFENLVNESRQEQKFIAHCISQQKKQLSSLIQNLTFDIQNNFLMLVGPEGDFTENEIQFALSKNYLPVALGDTRLRTETAGIAALVLLKL